MAEKIGTVGVDTGMVIIIDPVHLFTQEEWLFEIGPRAKDLGDYSRAVLEYLSEREGKDLKKWAVVADLKGDGSREVTQDDKGVYIED